MMNSLMQIGNDDMTRKATMDSCDGDDEGDKRQ
jgi:hypothetical protein